ncbi:MAG: hypothetical protein BHV99_01015 [Clostridium sp. 26_21]|nr:MAG: hypothetical protein BHV99_01015 [Clostridium sp. 26_21]
MEKTISVEERIRRAEQRYYNSNLEYNYTRKNNEIKKETPQNIKSKIKNKIVIKLIKEIIICLVIYIVFYCIINNNSLFSNDVREKAKEILSIDINFANLYSNTKCYILKLWEDMKSIEKNHIDEKITETTNRTIDDVQENNENIGGAIDEEGNVQENSEQVSLIDNEQQENIQDVQLSQMEEDAKFIKENISLIKPIEAVVSSRYGLRNPTTITVPKNHTGIDLAASTGTKIISATDGTVVLNSSEGDFGKHIKIQNGDTIFIYAHCSKIYVNEGDEIKQGQEIAEVGTTGNTTGPHLHFEIRYQNRTIDPELILEF